MYCSAIIISTVIASLFSANECPNSMPAEEARQVIGIDSQAELLSELHKKIVSNSGVKLRLSFEFRRRNLRNCCCPRSVVRAVSNLLQSSEHRREDLSAPIR